MYFEDERVNNMETFVAARYSSRKLAGGSMSQTRPCLREPCISPTPLLGENIFYPLSYPIISYPQREVEPPCVVLGPEYS